MTKRAKILLGMVVGMGWAIGVIVLGKELNVLGGLAGRTLHLALFGCGLVLLAMIGRLAQRRFFDDATIDGDDFAPGSPSQIDQRVLQNTLEQGVLAVCLWPFIGIVLQEGIVLALGINFVVARLLFWVGYHMSPPLRALGFAATFYPTILATILAVIIGWDLGVFAFLR